MKKISLQTKVFFAAIFVALVFASSKINFSALIGADNQFFTLFQFFGPVAGGILGPIFGSFIVLSAQIANLTLAGSFDLLSVLRLAPMVFAAIYFGTKKRNLSIIVPLIAMAAFIAHPVGMQVWFFSLFWTIPIIASFFKGRLISRSLGATFTAHSVGGAIWIYTVPMTPEMWIALIPIVIVERLLFAGGIAASYVAFNTLLSKVESSVPFVKVEEKFVLSRKIWKHF